MSDGWKAIGVICVIIFIGAFLYNVGYKDGQTDALSGKITYHLVTKPDSTRVWEVIK